MSPKAAAPSPSFLNEWPDDQDWDVQLSTPSGGGNEDQADAVILEETVSPEPEPEPFDGASTADVAPENQPAAIDECRETDCQSVFPEESPENRQEEIDEPQEAPVVEAAPPVGPTQLLHDGEQTPPPRRGIPRI